MCRGESVVSRGAAWQARLMARGTSDTITLPYEFDTSDVWRTILKGAFGLNALMIACILYGVVVSRQWMTVLGLAAIELLVVVFTRVFVRFQEGSVGVLTSDRVAIEPNVLFGVVLPGPRGTYALDRFCGVRVEFRSGPMGPDVQGGGPNEVVWLVGKPGTPDVALALTDDRAGREVGKQFGALLGLPVEEVGAPIEIQL